MISTYCNRESSWFLLGRLWLVCRYLPHIFRWLGVAPALDLRSPSLLIAWGIFGLVRMALPIFPLRATRMQIRNKAQRCGRSASPHRRAVSILATNTSAFWNRLNMPLIRLFYHIHFGILSRVCTQLLPGSVSWLRVLGWNILETIVAKTGEPLCDTQERPMTQSVTYPHDPAADVGIGGAYGWLQCILYFLSGLLDQVMWSSGCQGEEMMLLVSVRYKNAPIDGQSYPHSHKLHTLASFCRW